MSDSKTMTAAFLQRIFRKPGVTIPKDAFPGTLPFVHDLDVRFSSAVTFFVGENGSGKSTLAEAIADLCGLPVGGGGRSELSDLQAPHRESELAPCLGMAFRRHPPDAYFFRAEFQAHFATLLEQRKADPYFRRDPYARYGGQSLHTRSHGEAFLAVFSAWMSPGLIIMDEPEAALSPQRQLALLAQIARLVRGREVQFIIATHSPILLTYPGAQLLAFDGQRVEPTKLEDTSHFQITKGILERPEAYWRHLLAPEENDES